MYFLVVVSNFAVLLFQTDVFVALWSVGSAQLSTGQINHQGRQHKKRLLAGNELLMSRSLVGLEKVSSH